MQLRGLRVGLFLSDFDPVSGGGYTFQADVLEAIAAVARETSHRFVMLSDTKAIAEFAMALAGDSKFDVVQVPAVDVLDKAAALLKRSSGIARRYMTRPGRVERAARRAACELIWFVSAGGFEPTDIPYIGTVWDLQHRSLPWFPEVASSKQWTIREESLRLFLPRASMVIVGTEVGAVEVTQFYGVPRSHIRKLPHPTPRFALESHQSADRNVVLERLGIRTPYVFYPAQFWPHKNHVNLLHAIAHLGKQSGLRISVAFSGSDRGNLRYVEQVARELGIAEQVHFLGFVTRAELTSLYEGAIALAYVSFGGPENLPPLEAFALGCPVIAADIEGAREQLADAALLVNPSDPQKIAETIRQIHEDAQLRSDLIARGRQRAAAWTGTDFVRAALRVIDEFAAIRRCWPT